MGLGDHIICNGIVRHLKEIYGEVTVFCKPHNYTNVNYMYRDDINIIVLSVGNDDDVHNYIVINNINQDVIRIGFGGLSFDPSTSFDKDFYKMLEIPFEYRFSKFYLERDLEKEKNILEKLNPNNEPFIFVHDVDLNKVRKDLKIIENPKDFGIFELMSLIENAEEVHLMESSLKCLVNSFKCDKPKFYYHQYVRNYNSYLNSKGLNKFKIIY
jgi:hypothetical protein